MHNPGFAWFGQDQMLFPDVLQTIEKASTIERPKIEQ